MALFVAGWPLTTGQASSEHDYIFLPRMSFNLLKGGYRHLDILNGKICFAVSVCH